MLPVILLELILISITTIAIMLVHPQPLLRVSLVQPVYHLVIPAQLLLMDSV